jgi:multidrug transporter EmrE-like cation transporter
MKDNSFNYIVALSAIEIIGDFSLRWYAQTDKLQWLVSGLAGYAGVIFFLIQSFRTRNVLYVNGMWDGVSAILNGLASFFLLGDRLEKPSQYTGLIMIIIGVFLLKNGF